MLYSGTGKHFHLLSIYCSDDFHVLDPVDASVALTVCKISEETLWCYSQQCRFSFTAVKMHYNKTSAVCADEAQNESSESRLCDCGAALSHSFISSLFQSFVFMFVVGFLCLYFG